MRVLSELYKQNNSVVCVSSVVLMQVVYIIFLFVYGTLIVTRFHQYPFLKSGRGFEIFILLYISGITFEEVLQAGSFCCVLQL